MRWSASAGAISLWLPVMLSCRSTCICWSTSPSALCYRKRFRPSSCQYRCEAGNGPSGRRITTISTFRRMRSLWRSCATSIATRSVEGWSRNRRIGSGRAFATIKRVYEEPWRSNRIGQPDKEVGSCPSGCAMPGLSPRLPRFHRVDQSPLPRSPKARDRGHPPS